MRRTTNVDSYDILALGRSSIDLYANEIGAPFTEVKSFSAYVGGSPTNVTVCARRLGLRAALLTAVGCDLVGDFVLDFLRREGVEAGFSPRKPGRRTSAFMLAIQPPDNFAIVPYRDNCADLELTVEDVRAAPVAESRALLLTGSGLGREPSRAATRFAAETARAHGRQVVLDLDFRAELWPDPREYSAEVRELLPLVHVVLGTAEEVLAALGLERERGGGAEGAGGASAPLRALKGGVNELLAAGPEALVVKRGAGSTLVFARGGEVSEAATFPVEVLNVLGAGDAFAGGFLYGYLKGWGWRRAARMGNACGAIVVTRHGCANFMPTEEEVLAFIEERGG
ncbi:MAG TPA: 5-dehydro-2-deoxygluconokinase, partial [Pyrinomonadaceae bacterium]|nr:5-dehydro-2-deoxygluconokinase [Pyrinomonadaceae bacterium]